MDLFNHITKEVIFSAEVPSVKDLLLAAIVAKANLSGADLSGANLSWADLYRANLYRADLSGADLSGANLSGADLSGANLYRANLYRANLSGADLSGANLYRANLSGANLSGADLSGTDLSGVNAKINGHSLVQINGLAYPIFITDTYLHAGCQKHTFAVWRSMTPERIAQMDGARATEFYPTLIGIIDLFCKDREAK